MNQDLFKNLKKSSGIIRCKGLEIPTMLGNIVFNIYLAEELTHFNHEYYEMENEIYLRKWETETFLMEALTIFYDYGSIEFPTDRSFAQVFRLYAKKDIPISKFQISLMNNDIFCESSDDWGEHLEALSFVSPKGALTMGTDDMEVLNARAYRNDWLPKRWKGIFDYFPPKYPFEFTENSITTTFPELFEGDKLQVSYVVSWVSSLYKPFNARLAADMPVKTLFEEKKLEY